jgi:hypothetical protein
VQLIYYTEIDHVQKQVDYLLARLKSFQESNEPANLHLAFRCAAMDIITSYCFAKSHNTLETPGFKNHIIMGIQNSWSMSWLIRYVPWLVAVLRAIPVWLLLRMNPQLKGITDLRSQVENQIDETLRDPASLQSADHEIIYHYWLQLDSGKRQLRPSKNDLLHEAINFKFAGTDTVGNICTVGTFHVLNNKAVREILVKELDAIWPDRNATLAYEVLEKLPYLVRSPWIFLKIVKFDDIQTAVIKESLRIGVGAVTPLPRVVGPGDAEIAGINVQAGVGKLLIGMKRPG